ncbi:GSCOCG00002118001-RA-CDS [Cotesia congregata]|nr:GSCOCG00002118001-RA-CDS [Cotesia congregata]
MTWYFALRTIFQWRQRWRSEKKEPKTEVVITSNLKRSAKSERKQRLMVRADDSMDIEIKFDEIKYESKFNDTKEKEKEKEKEDSENLSEKEDEEAEAERSSANPSPTLSNPVGGFRSARRKRAKKVFDPSDNNVVKRKRGRYATAATKASLQVTTQDSQDSTSSKPSVKETGRKCSLCYKDKAESLIPCRDCTVRAHPSCIYSPDDLLLKTGSSWQCERCKSCTVCCETSDIGPLLTCYTCDDAYHYSCHTPRVIRSGSKWQCCECKPQPSKTVTTVVPTASTALTTNSTASTTPTASITTPAAAPRSETPPQTPTLPPVLSPQVSPSRESLEAIEDETIPRDSVIDPNIPDASDWTSEQVYQYFARLFPKEAEVFRMQDIDGHSLLLMKRSDVLIGLDLLLGPALKIYRHVLKLQMRRDETRFYWL